MKDFLHVSSSRRWWTIVAPIAILLAVSPSKAAELTDASLEGVGLVAGQVVWTGPLSEQEDPCTADVAWVWSERLSPQRLDSSSCRTFDLATATESRQVALVLEGSDNMERVPLKVVVAPLQMWLEVPESLLPVIEVEGDGQSEIRTDPSTKTQIRVIGENIGSNWTMISPGVPTVTAKIEAAADRCVTVNPESSKGVKWSQVEVLSSEGTYARLVDKPGSALCFSGLPGGKVLTLIASASNHLPRALNHRPSAWPSAISLERGAAAEGLILSSETQLPLEGAVVSLEAWLSDDSSVVFRKEASTDEKGHWTIPAAPRTSLVLRVEKKGFGTITQPLRIDGDRITVPPIFLREGKRVRITVRDPEGIAIEKAEVRWSGTRSFSNAEGAVELADLAPDTLLEIEVRKQGFMAAAFDIDPNRDMNEVRLQPAYTIDGMFVDHEGLPVASARVKVELGDHEKHQLIENGAFHLEVSPHSDVVLSFQGPGTGEATVSLKTGLPGGSKDLGVVRAPRGVMLRGQIFSESNGSYLEGATAWVPRPDSMGPEISWMKGEISQASSDYDGVFELSGLGSLPFLLRIDAPGHGRRTVEVSPMEEERVIDLGIILLSQGKTVSVTTDASSESNAIAEIDVRGEGSPLDILKAPFVNGRADISDVPSGSFDLIVRKRTMPICYKRVEVDKADPEVHVYCETDLTNLSGSVLVGERPVSGGMITLRRSSAERPAGIMTHKTKGGAIRQDVVGSLDRITAPVDSQGRFGPVEVLAGRWTATWIAEGGSGTTPQTLDIPQTREAEINLSFAGGKLEGTVVDSNQRPVALARVEEVSSQSSVLSKQDGTFVIAGLPPGSYHVRAWHRDRESRTKTVIVEEKAALPIRLVLEDSERERFSVEVLGPAGTPAPGAYVFVESSGGLLQLLTTNGIGTVDGELLDNEAVQFRIAAANSEGMYLGPWQTRKEMQQLMKVRLQRAARMLIDTEKAGRLTIASSDGWNVSGLLERLGRSMFLMQGETLITPLIRGSYTVSLGEMVRVAEVSDGRTVVVKFDS